MTGTWAWEVEAPPASGLCHDRAWVGQGDLIWQEHRHRPGRNISCRKLLEARSGALTAFFKTDARQSSCPSMRFWMCCLLRSVLAVRSAGTASIQLLALLS